jgi:hypothetical protein
MELELKSSHLMGIPYGGISGKFTGKDLAFVAGSVVLMRGLAVAGSIGLSLAMELLSLINYKPAPHNMPPIPLAYWLTQISYDQSTFYGFITSTAFKGELSNNKNFMVPMERIVRLSSYGSWGTGTNIQTVEGSIFGKVGGTFTLEVQTVAGPLKIPLPRTGFAAHAAGIPDLDVMRARFEESLKYNISEITNILGKDFLSKYFNIHILNP